MTYKVPGVYSSLTSAPNVLATGELKVLALVGTAPKGTNVPTNYYSAADAFSDFGSPNDPASNGYTLPLAIQLAFQNGAQVICVARAGVTLASKTFKGSSSHDVITFTARNAYAGTVGNSITVTVAAGTGSGKKITVIDGLGKSEIYDNLADNQAIVDALNASSGIVTATLVTNTYLIDNISATNLADGADGGSASTGDIEDAIDTLNDVDVDIVVVLSGNTTVLGYAKTHVDTMSNSTNRKERIMVGGLAANSTSDQINTEAGTLADGRCVLVAPATVNHYNVATQTMDAIDGFYLAAAIGGLAAGLSPEMPLTRRLVNGFDSLKDIYSVSTMNTLAGGGVLIVYNNQGLRVRHGLTTAVSTNTFSEISVRRADDHVQQFVRAALDSYVGQPSRAETAVVIREACKSALTEMVNEGKIAAWGSVSCTQNRSTPTQYDVVYSYQPAWPVNWIEVSYSITN